MKFAADRVLGLALIGLAAFAAYQASRFQVIFSYEPVGPKAFPMLLSAVLAGLSLVLVIRPGENGAWPSRTVALKLVLVLGVLLAYALLFTRAGYVLSTGLAVLALARLFGAGLGQGDDRRATDGRGFLLPLYPWPRHFPAEWSLASQRLLKVPGTCLIF